MRTLSEVRGSFISFFRGKGHAIVDSSPLVPEDDPSLLFTNAGMVQFKGVFTGLERRGYTRAASAQKCLRAGGKHNDLDSVGYSGRHHTFFEMLGNFSFGDYFKEEAILYAWEYLVGCLNIPKERLYVTVHVSDEESAQFWKKIAGLSNERIIRIGTDDNFWMMGDSGPCGPCTEIFYDHGSQVAGGLPGTDQGDGDRYTEVWNLVFMTYEQLSSGKRIDLPAPCVDTGIGLERLTALLQNKTDNYDTDLFQLLIKATAQLSQTALGDSTHRVSHRVIADHIRSICFLIADGVTPSNTGRGYVLRRIMRRAMRHAKLLGVKEPILKDVVPVLVNSMKEAYPELERSERAILGILQSEEDRFWDALERGTKVLNEYIKNIGSSRTFPGDLAFNLYDTYGFPLDLTEDILRGYGLEVDKKCFERCMSEQKETSRKTWVGSGDAKKEGLWAELNNSLEPTRFLGYETLEAEGVVLSFNDPFAVFDQTPFYAEQGGQVGDVGSATRANGEALSIIDVQRRGALYVHKIGEHDSPQLSPGERVLLKVDRKKRLSTQRNHTATHILHAALKAILGGEVHQRGSLVEPGRIRFDFNYPRALTSEQIVRIETHVNSVILLNVCVESMEMPKTEALNMGAQAVFGEKYPEEVRVLKIGNESLELCSGTHAARTGDIGFFKIVSENSIASGIRRLVAITGDKAHDYVLEMEKSLSRAALLLRVGREQFLPALSQLVEERKKLSREVIRLLCQNVILSEDKRVKRCGAHVLWSQIIEGFDHKDTGILVDKIRNKIKSGVVLLVFGKTGQRGHLVVSVTKDLMFRLRADTILGEIVERLGGKGGGGRSDLARGSVEVDQFQSAETLVCGLLSQLPGSV